MQDLLMRVEFWLGIGLAVAYKLRSSEKLSVGLAVFTVVTSVASAIVFTPFFAQLLNFESDHMKIALGSLIALTSEHFARQLLVLDIKGLLSIYFGRGNKK